MAHTSCLETDATRPQETSAGERRYPDPLDFDMPEDLPLVVTRRRLVRLALVAAEVGARFERDGIDHDPMAWMLAPRVLFEGRNAIEAALDRDDCIRALLLHGLALGTDARPETVDALREPSAGRARRAPRPRGSERRPARMTAH